MNKIYTFLFGLCSIVSFSQDLPPIKSGVISWDSLLVRTDNGKERRLLLEPRSTTHLKLFRIHATTLPPKTQPNPPHPNKDADELIIVKEGKVKFTVGNQSKILEKGGVAVILSDEIHGLENIGETPATYYVLRYQSKQPTDLERGQKAGGSLLINPNEIIYKPHNRGGRRDYYNRPTSQCQIFEMHTTTLNAGLESHQPHQHATEEALLITKGEVIILIDCKIHHAKAGDLVIIDSNVPHGLINNSSSQCEYFAFTWK